MASKVADGLHKLVAGGLISISAAGVGAIGWGVYSLYVLRPAHLKAQAESSTIHTSTGEAAAPDATATSENGAAAGASR